MKTTLIKIFTISSLAAIFAGCAVFGADVQRLNEIEGAQTKIFDKDISRCYELTAEALKKWNAIKFQESRDGYIVAMELEGVFHSCINTTELGIFFTETEPHKTEVKVASLNQRLSQFIAPELFKYIEKDGNLSKEEELKPSKIKTSSNPFKK